MKWHFDGFMVSLWNCYWCRVFQTSIYIFDWEMPNFQEATQSATQEKLWIFFCLFMMISFRIFMTNALWRLMIFPPRGNNSGGNALIFSSCLSYNFSFYTSIVSTPCVLILQLHWEKSVIILHYLHTTLCPPIAVKLRQNVMRDF